jgi:hypothetical protein
MAERLNDLRGNERSSEQIRQEIAAKRESLSEAVGKLGDKIHDTMDWRGYVTRHPYAALGVAAGAGILISGVLVRRRTSPTQRIVNALADTAEDVTEDLRKTVQRAVAHIFFKSGPPLMIKGALYGAASKAMASLLQSKLAGNGRDAPHAS